MSLNPNSRLEAFCDGVFAIALTLLIIEIKVPESSHTSGAPKLWPYLAHLAPMIFAFLLSFTIVFICWVNHHASIKLVDKSSSHFIYANGFLLLSIVIIPFLSALMGQYLLTAHAGTAVMLYTASNGVQALGWIMLSSSAIKGGLTKSDKALIKMKEIKRNGYFALTLYTFCALLALWFPLTIAVVITIVWLIWLLYGISIKE